MSDLTTPPDTGTYQNGNVTTQSDDTYITVETNKPGQKATIKTESGATCSLPIPESPNYIETAVMNPENASIVLHTQRTTPDGRTHFTRAEVEAFEVNFAGNVNRSQANATDHALLSNSELFTKAQNLMADADGYNSNQLYGTNLVDPKKAADVHAQALRDIGISCTDTSGKVTSPLLTPTDITKLTKEALGQKK